MTATNGPKRSLGGYLARFSTVGLLATACYFALANLFMVVGILAPAAASVTAYLLAMAVSFLGQSRYTFGAEGNRGEFARFCLLSAVGLAISFGAVRIAEHVGAPPFWGTLATAMLVPALSFAAMKLWVFAAATNEGRRT